MARPRVVLEKNFVQHRHKVERAIERGLELGGHDIAKTAKGQPTNYRIQGILGSIHSEGVRKSRRGYEVSAAYGDWRSNFFESGTRAKRGAGKTKAAKLVAGGRGIKAGRFLKKGLKEAAPRIDGYVQAAMR